jgi:hypothetical protein
MRNETHLQLLTAEGVIHNRDLHTELRRQGPVLWSGELDAWIAPRHEQASRVLTDKFRVRERRSPRRADRVPGG